VASSEFRERLIALAEPAGIAVPLALVDLLGVYLDLLSRWNTRINLTSLSLAPLSDQALRRLILEPLAAAALVPDEPRSWFDIGSGGGSPAIPLKLARPSLNLHMVESTSKKAAFLRETARILGLDRSIVLAERLEVLATNRERQGTADLITMRAVKPTEPILRACRQLASRRAELLFFCTDEAQEMVPWFAHESTVLLAGSLQSKLAQYRPMFHVEQSS